jgi:hypothetical protein
MNYRYCAPPGRFSLRPLSTVLLLSLFAAPGWGASASSARGGSEGEEWPFVPLRRLAVPQVRHKSWVRNPIDAFVLARLEKAGLQPNPPADKLTLLRRVTFDLTGLPPTPEERDAFLADHSPDAYERLVDRLLRSPHFGERWAQHWLDVVRFAETEGFKFDRLRPEAWRYRDYVIRACNNDLPYDRFVRQQLAGDELEPDNPDALIATGFYRLHPEETNGSNYRMIRQDILDDVTDVFGTTFLGLTLGCARCHDHKFDPLTQKDYFRMQAFFTPLMQRDDYPMASPAEQARYRRELAKWEERTKEWRAKRDALLIEPRRAVFADVVATFDSETRKAMYVPPAKRTPLQRQLAALAGKQVDRRVSRAYRRLPKDKRAIYDDLRKKIEAGKPQPLPTAMGVSNIDGEAPATYRLGTGNYLKPRERVQPGFPECLDSGERGADATRSAHNRGMTPPARQRSDLARWLCRPDHPLTSRVIVNRLWLHHLGSGIVATPNDFGAQGEKPTHPELLDYLAGELVRQGWKLKTIHRLIVTSATYRQASSPRCNSAADKAVAADPGNKLLWHARVKRREAEAIRDAILQVSGQLNPRMGGPSNCPILPAAMKDTDYAWTPDEQPRERNRRSIYLLAKRNFAYPLFAAFDQPDRVNSCPVRPATITAPQALTMLNGEFTLTQARHLAGLLLTASDRRDAGASSRGSSNRAAAPLIRAAYLRAFSREPDPAELAAAQKFLSRQAQLIGSRSGAAREALPEPNPPGLDPAFAAAVVDFCHALLNSAEFLDVE